MKLVLTALCIIAASSPIHGMRIPPFSGGSYTFSNHNDKEKVSTQENNTSANTPHNDKNTSSEKDNKK